MSTFLIIDRDENRLADITNFFRSLGHSLREAADWPGAAGELAQREFDVVVSSVAIAGGSVRELIRTVKAKSPDTAVIVHADLGTTQEGLAAVQEGAFGIVQSPFSLPELSFQIKRALERRAQKLAPGAAGAGAATSAPGAAPGATSLAAPEAYRPYNFIGESVEMRRVFAIVSRVAKTDSSVIITGETGTGKELVAGAIHYNSSRAGGHFVRVNCAALPEQLLESELFGHEKGAFTGADRARIGRFEHANGGTIFLDEIADMSQFTQSKVLRVIQEKEFERLGSNETVKTDVRIVSATNRDLLDLMRKGLFREDLFFRLNVVAIRLPPLRERTGDVALLAEFFLKRFAAEMGRKVRGIEPGAMRMLAEYHWPGNIRELENTMERAVLMAEGDRITAADLSLFFAGEGPDLSADAIRLPAKGIRLEDAERQLIVQALERAGWVQKDAARLLGVSSRALNYKIKSFGITHPGWKQNR